MNSWYCPALSDPFYGVMDDTGMEPRFGMGLLPRDFSRVLPRQGGTHHLPTGYRRPWAVARQDLSELNKDQKNHHFGKDGFQACVDVHHFQPSEITVKTIDHTVIVEGKHEDRDDGLGFVQRHFIRKYVLPKEYDMSQVHSNLSTDGVLTIKAPQVALLRGSEKVIQITNTGMPAHLCVKENHQAKCSTAAISTSSNNGKAPGN